MDEIRELLQNLAQLSAEDLDGLKGKIIAAANDVPEEDTPENVSMLNELADALESVAGRQTEMQAEATQRAEQREAARQRIAAINGTQDDDAEDASAPEAETTDTPEADAEETETEDAPEPVTAAAGGTGRIARMAARNAKPKPSPESAPAADTRTSLVASGEVRGVTPGTELDKESLAVAMTETLARQPQPQGPSGSRGRDVVVASANWGHQYPDDRKVTGDWDHDAKIVREAFEPDALVATGGICAPVNVDWSIGMIATADRPLQSALPSFQAGRGGLIYRPDLDFGALTSATGIWTEATDLSPAGATKPIFTVACPGTQTVYVEAVSTRLGFGNMQSRFDPETVAANTDAAMAAYARVADNNLLNLIAAACTQNVTNTKALGATRDLLECLGQIIAGFRNLHRIPRSQAVRAIFPDWMKELLRIDLAREIGHGQSDQWNSLMVTDQQIEDLFTPYGVTPIWHLDGQTSGTQGVSQNQFFATQSTGAINAFPTAVTWYLYYEGAFQYLDGGRLDLGIVRDSLLDSTNDYETFVEVFETVAYRGFTGGALQLNTSLCASGGSAGTQNTQASTSTTCP